MRKVERDTVEESWNMVGSLTNAIRSFKRTNHFKAAGYET